MSQTSFRKEVIDLLSDSDNDDTIEVQSCPIRGPVQVPQTQLLPLPRNPYLSEPPRTLTNSKIEKSRPTKKLKVVPTEKPRQAGLVLEEDVDVDDCHDERITVDSYIQIQQSLLSQGKSTTLFEDVEFPTLPRSIRGPKRDEKKVTCRCKGSIQAILDYKCETTPTNNKWSPFYRCAQKRCKFYSSAFQAERLHWYRFGPHTGHLLVGQSGFSADDLCQGRVGDCWFLSALAVVAERPDLILRLFGKYTQLNEFGICQVNLFLDGYWKAVIVDNFLPCMIDDQGEDQIQQAIQASLRTEISTRIWQERKGRQGQSSNHDPNALADQCRQVLRETREYLEQDITQKRGLVHANVAVTTDAIERQVTSEDLAYSKAKNKQLWVPLLEKAYAKSHGSYQAISGGQIAEAFLDLTGAPTLVYQFDSADFQPRQFWNQLMKFRKQRLPMGCGTDQSQVGIIGMHAYSILDVVEIKNVSFEFFQETGVAHGNVSGFTELDGTVRLLQIRNPHGKSEWKGDFSDHSDVWEKLLKHQRHGSQRLGSSYKNSVIADKKVNDEDEKLAHSLERTMRNDGKFWIDYDSFLMGFSNVDVVLAFLGNHAKSFSSNFPPKKSNHRCVRAFEVSLLDPQHVQDSRDSVELYIMGIQKTRRGAGHGRVDRKVSYKVCDLGLLVAEWQDGLHRDVFVEDRSDDNDYWHNLPITSVQGQMFGFQRNGHYHLVLDRKTSKSLVVMPISFGHPSATDKELPFVLRFVSDAPLLIKEIPSVPRLDQVIQKFCLSPSRALSSKQGTRTVVVEGPSFRLTQIDCLKKGGGTVFLYLCIDDSCLAKGSGLCLSVEIRCRGMSCRTEEGLIQHETVAKGKKFEAAWRKFEIDFPFEAQSRLLAVIFQSGQDSQFGSIVCKHVRTLDSNPKPKSILEGFMGAATHQKEEYFNRGIFNGVAGNEAYQMSNNSIIETKSRPYSYDMTSLDVNPSVDLELQQALALSLQDINTHASDDHCIQENLCAKYPIDPDSVPVCPQSPSTLDAVLSSVGDDDDDLRRAIEMSLNDTKPAAKPTKNMVVGVVDLTASTNSAAKPTKNMAVGVVDLTAFTNGKSRGLPASEARSASLEAATSTSSSLEEKRRLVADAALIRMAKK